ncbi:MAG: SDR family NAD(P)-dependent oxidoreductase [Candidatus Roizmanbacteria bacterium]
MDIIAHDSLMNLSGKVAIVTGGSEGIGYGITYRLAEAGAKVMIACRTEEQAEKVKQEGTSKGWQIDYIKTDVATEADVVNLVQKTVETFGEVNILVNNAGIYPSIPLANLTLADFEKIIRTNLFGVFLTTNYVSKQMIKQGKGGKIINITSIDALHPSSIGLAAYDASKHGVWGFTKNVALELSAHKIWVNAIAPGGIVTPGVKESQSNAPVPNGVDMAKIMEAFMQKIPMHRMGEPDEIGKVALFLASDMSSYMTGSQIVVDGGVLLS